MTNEQALEILQLLPDAIIATVEPFDIHYDYKEALRVAIQALKREEELTEYMRGYLAGCNDTSNKLKELSNLSIRISKEDMI